MFDRILECIFRHKAVRHAVVVAGVLIFLWLAFQPCPGCEGGVPGNY